MPQLLRGWILRMVLQPYSVRIVLGALKLLIVLLLSSVLLAQAVVVASHLSAHFFGIESTYSNMHLRKTHMRNFLCKNFHEFNQNGWFLYAQGVFLLGIAMRAKSFVHVNKSTSFHISTSIHSITIVPALRNPTSSTALTHLPRTSHSILYASSASRMPYGDT